MTNKEGDTPLKLAEAVQARQVKKVEVGPNHDECVLLLKNRMGFADPEEQMKKLSANIKGGKKEDTGGKKPAFAATGVGKLVDVTDRNAPPEGYEYTGSPSDSK